MPNVGPSHASGVRGGDDDATRFRGAHEVEAYLGLVPRELSSGETRGRITKAGHSRVRRLLVQAAVSMLRRPDPRTVQLRAWALRIAARRGKKVAVVALARRVSGILFAMLRDGTSYCQHSRATRAGLVYERGRGPWPARCQRCRACPCTRSPDVSDPWEDPGHRGTPVVHDSRLAGQLNAQPG